MQARKMRTIPTDARPPKGIPAIPAGPKAPRITDLEPEAPPDNVKVLTIDIETAPLESYTWGTWEQNVGVDQIKTDWSILSYAAKWLGRKQPIYRDTGGRGVDKVRDDAILLPEIWALLNEAHIVVAQNGIKFDIKKINWRFLENGYTPPAPYRVVDTLRVSRQTGAASSHKLAWLSQKLTDTPKGKHHKFPGFELWLECLKDNPAAWAEMKKYNIQDIQATEKLYLRLRPWIKNPPNMGTYNLAAGASCPNCGSKNIEPRGQQVLRVGIYAQYTCGACGAWSRGKEMLNPLEVRASKLVAA